MAKLDIAYRVGRRIRVPEVRVIGADSAQLGIMAVEQALLIADRAGLDLVEVSPKTVPPVCRIMDYGKFKYELSKKTRGTRAHTVGVDTKEIKFRPKTDDHDMAFKLRHVRRFLGAGAKVRLVVAFKGREITHIDIGRALLGRVFKQVADLAVIEQQPALDAKRMVMIVAPRVGVVQRAGAAASAAAPAAAASASGSPGAPGR